MSQLGECKIRDGSREGVILKIEAGELSQILYTGWYLPCERVFREINDINAGRERWEITGKVIALKVQET